jgi:hypothetical protein
VVVTLLHPAFWNQSPVEDPATGERFRKVTVYLEHEEWWVKSFGGHRHYHQPLSFYVDWLTREGFAVIELFEPPVPWPTPPEEQTGYEKWITSIPTMMGLAFTTLDRGSTVKSSGRVRTTP